MMIMMIMMVMMILIGTHLAESLKEWKKDILDKSNLGRRLCHSLPKHQADINHVEGVDEASQEHHQSHHLQVIYQLQRVTVHYIQNYQARLDSPVHERCHRQCVLLLLVRLVEVFLKQAIHPPL